MRSLLKTEVRVQNCESKAELAIKRYVIESDEKGTDQFDAYKLSKSARVSSRLLLSVFPAQLRRCFRGAMVKAHGSRTLER